MRLANQGETADRITLEMLMAPTPVLVLVLSPKTTGMSQQLEERLGMGRGADGSEGFEADDGTFDSKFEDDLESFSNCVTPSSWTSSVETSPSSLSSSFASNIQNRPLDISGSKTRLTFNQSFGMEWNRID